LRVRRVAGFGEQVRQIEPAREHGELAVGGQRPLCLRPIPIKLDAVIVGIAQIDRLADAVIGSAFERNLGVEHAAQRRAERRAGRIEDRQMIEAGGARRRLSQVLSPM